MMNEPYSLEVDADGSIYIVDRLNAAVRRVDGATGIISTVAGTGEPGYSGDGGPGNAAQLREPNDCFLDGRGGLLIADIQDQRIRRLDLATGVINTFAGNGEKVRGGDGMPATQASILGARAVCMDSRGNTFIAEREGNGVRIVTAGGIMGTVAGTDAERGYSGDGGSALAAMWGAPKALRCDANDNIIVVDTENHAIRRIDANTGIVTTIAGGELGGHGDGGAATDAGMDRPARMRNAANGDIYVADSNNQSGGVSRFCGQHRERIEQFDRCDGAPAHTHHGRRFHSGPVVLTPRVHCRAVFASAERFQIETTKTRLGAISRPKSEHARLPLQSAYQTYGAGTTTSSHYKNLPDILRYTSVHTQVIQANFP